MLITESELRSIVRQIIIEEARLDEGKVLDAIKSGAKKITSKAIIPFLTALIFFSGGVSTGLANDFKNVVESTITEMNVSAAVGNQLRLFSAKLGDNLEVKMDVKNMSPEEAEEVKKAGNELAAYASSQEIPPKTFFNFLKNLVKKIKLLKPASKPGSSFPHEILDDNIEVKVKDDFYYLYHKGMKIYYKAPKKHFDHVMETGEFHDWSDELLNDDNRKYKTREEQVKGQLKLMSDTDIENELVWTFQHLIRGTWGAKSPRLFNTKVTLKGPWQNKVKGEYNSIE